MSEFYRNAKILDKLVALSNPTHKELDQLLDIISSDSELAIYYYGGNTNAEWLDLLKGADEFESLKDSEGEVDRSQELKASYLRNVAKKKPKEVFEVFTNIGKLHRFFRRSFLNALLDMSEDIAVKSVPDVLSYLKREEQHGWYSVGDGAAKLMVKLAEKYPNEAFTLAESLLEVWEQEKGGSGYRDIQSKFKAYEYQQLMFKYYNTLLNIDPYRATKLIVKTFETYLGEVQKSKDYEASSHFYISVERLDKIDRIDRDIIAVLISGICEAGKVVIEKQQGKIDELFDGLESRKRHIFDRIEMYLLKFVTDGTQQERISDIIRNEKYLETSGFEYEYRFLLRDKFEDVGQDARMVFENWVKAKNLTDDDKENIRDWFKNRKDRDATDKDFEKIENSDKAKALYLVKKQFPELYEKSRAKSMVSDEELAPEPRMSEARFVSPTEGSPICPEEMGKMKPMDALTYILDENRWQNKKHTSPFHTPQEGLEGALREDVQKRADDYAKLNMNELIKLKPEFLSRYFYGIENALREKGIENTNLVKVIEHASCVAREKEGKEEYRESFSAILSIVGGIFNDEDLKEVIAKTNSKLIWGIIEPLTKFDYNPDVFGGDDTNPLDECINSVQGKAFELVIRFGLIHKNDDIENYNEAWSIKIKSVLTYMVDKVETPKTTCVFGAWFPQLHWLEEEWICDNLEIILGNENDNMWNVVWGLYITRSRPFKKVFEFLVEQGKYKRAIEKIGSTIKYRHSKDPEEGLVEHLMIAFFNGWIELDDDLLKQFFNKAPVELRGQAAEFLTTGFETLIEKPDKKTSERLKRYWKMRLLEISKKPSENIEEAVEFTGWINNTPLEKKETFDLLYKTLELTDGKLGEGRSNYDFMEGIYETAQDCKLVVLQCLNKAMNDERMARDLFHHEEKAKELMESVVKLPDEYPDVQEIRREAIKLIDAYGRRHVHQLRSFYEKLSKIISD